MAEPQNQPLPGSVVTPGGSPSTPPPSPSPPPQPQPEPAAPEPPLPSAAPVPAEQALPVEPQTPPPAQITPSLPETEDGQSVNWTASEFVAHSKSSGWYASLLLGTVILAAGVFLLTHDKISTGVILVAGLLLGVYGSHQPRQLEYVINNRGIGVDGKYHAYEDFRSFAIVPEGALSSLVFMPLKRFAVPLTVYYAPADEDRIIAILSDRLPLEEHRHDAIDSLLRRMRF